MSELPPEIPYRSDSRLFDRCPEGGGRQLLSELGRHDESRDQARVALCSPWWTLGASYARVVDLAGYADKEPAWVRAPPTRVQARTLGILGVHRGLYRIGK
jgi:hypothetical protein